MLAGAVPLYYFRVGRIEGLRDMFYVLEFEPYKKAFFIALLQTFLYTLSAKTMITIGVDVRVSAVFQADGTFELFV